MGNIHVSPGLEPDQRICKPVSFYDLFDLMTFSQITFGRSDQMRHGRRQPPALKHISWALLDHENAIDWDQVGAPDSTLYLVSSIRALSMSLLADIGITIFISQTRRRVHLPDGLTAPPTGAGTQVASLAKQAAALPLLEDDTVSVIVDTPNGALQDASPPTQLRLLVDLGTLLTGVIIYPGAS